MNDEKYKAALRHFNGDAKLMDELLAGIQREARGSEKDHAALARLRLKAYVDAGGDDFLAGPRAWLQKTGGH